MQHIKKKIIPISMTELNVNEECVICLENLDTCDTVRLMCDHQLHIQCLHGLLSNTKEKYTLCPICRKLLCTHYNVTKYISFYKSVIAGCTLLFILSVMHIGMFKYKLENEQ
jgi:hypothetical protein